MDFSETTINYIQNLRLPNNEILITNRRKIGFIGLIGGLKNIRILYEQWINSGELKYIPFYKLNQDHVELFFSTVRSSLGYNNNPTVKQFQSAYKKLLVRVQIRENGLGNCIPLQEIDILNTYSVNPDKEINSTCERQQMLQNEIELEENTNIEYYEHLQDHCYIYRVIRTRMLIR